MQWLSHCTHLIGHVGNIEIEIQKLLPIRWVLEALSYGIRPLRHEIDHSAPAIGKVKNVWNCVSTPPVCVEVMAFHFAQGCSLFSLTS